eukprot:CAMPEP_0172523670 /NCGR_PEP_ID=MMETSP1066-20121228/293783_1 /TAXON_ID=671091 /ORGANISM="Coscinodiscus wailesii, Strain CCMP2513" /LENGTH=154 /DNA_ID=CAMNT_0013306755 /DNA_START=624 /DNA_END=1085 /DNA_ORIENTATION=-
MKALIGAHPGAIVMKDGEGDTPLEIFCRAWNRGLKEIWRNDDTWRRWAAREVSGESVARNDFGDERGLEYVYDVGVLLLRAYRAFHATDVASFRPLVASLTVPECPWSLFRLMLCEYPEGSKDVDEFGNLALHVAAAAPSSCDDQLYRIRGCKK